MKKIEKFNYRNCNASIIVYQRKSGKYDGEIRYITHYPEKSIASSFVIKKI